MKEGERRDSGDLAESKKVTTDRRKRRELETLKKGLSFVRETLVRQ